MEEKEFLALFDITLNDNIIVKAKDKKDAIIKVREILENVDRATSIDEIVRIINGADRQVPTSLVEVEKTNIPFTFFP